MYAEILRGLLRLSNERILQITFTCYNNITLGRWKHARGCIRRNCQFSENSYTNLQKKCSYSYISKQLKLKWGFTILAILISKPNKENCREFSLRILTSVLVSLVVTYFENCYCLETITRLAQFNGGTKIVFLRSI